MGIRSIFRLHDDYTERVEKIERDSSRQREEAADAINDLLRVLTTTERHDSGETNN